MVTASLFAIHRKAKSFLLILVIGYVGSIGIATLSDSVIPYLGESLIGLHIPTHAELHAEDQHTQEIASLPYRQNDDTFCGLYAQKHAHKIYLGFIEEWYIVNPAALLGVLIAYFLPRTKFPHAGHVLISTWASSSHILMSTAGEVTLGIMAGIFATLFVAVWLPCCISDIVFPLLFVKSDLRLTDVCVCPVHAVHSHPHKHEHTKECPSGKEGKQ